MFKSLFLATSLASWPEVDYAMRLSLDEEAHVVEGTSRLSFTNESERELRELWFHLYMNAFEHRETVFLREQRDGAAGSRSGRSLRRPGKTRVLSLTWIEHGPEDLWRLADPHSPGDPNDKTDIRLPLPRPIGPGERVELELVFSTELPELVERSGFEGDFHLISGFYPKLARLSPSGEFDHFTYHPLAEFAGNFGDYSVELDVPEAHKVGATGEILSRRRTAGRLILTTRAHRVHDFAWASSPSLAEATKTIGRAQVVTLVPEADRGLAGRYFELFEQLFPHFEERYGPYEHQTLTVVHPPGPAAPAGGMEYPRFITTGGPALAQLLGIRYRELVTAHEFGHQWFQGMIASNEHAEPWLDESLTTLAEHRYLESRHGPGTLFSTPFLRVSALAGWRLGGLDTREPSALLSAPAYRDFPTLARTIYARAPLALETIRRVYGPSLDRAIREYAMKFRFNHPTTNDFMEILAAQDTDAASGLQALLEGQLSGYRLGSVETILDAEGLYQTVAKIAGEGALTLPSSLLMTFEDGQVERFPVQGEATVRWRHAARLRRACVDPDEALLLDPDRINNCFRPSLATSGQQSLFYSLAAILLSIFFT